MDENRVKIDLANVTEALKEFSADDYEGMMGSMLKLLHEKTQKLTGEEWCPYPSFLFAGVVISLPDDGIAKTLIVARRKILAPAFFENEPQESRLVAIANEFNLMMTFNKKTKS
jgi:hypothetical protein